MSFDLCKKTDRGCLTDLSAIGEGLDSKIISTDGQSATDQPFAPKRNYVKDTSVRARMEGQKNVFKVIVPEQGDLLTGAMLLLRTIHHPETLHATTDDHFHDEHEQDLINHEDDYHAEKRCSTELIDNIEIRIHGQCIQKILQNWLFSIRVSKAVAHYNKLLTQ